jgi:hypothetical protein
MRYIKLFESFEDELLELLEFTEVHLVYLIDDGFEISVNYSHNYGGGCKKISIVRRSGFTWEEIIDRFTPFIYMLDKEYKIFEVSFHQTGGRVYSYDSNSDIKRLLEGEADQYLTNKLYWMITIIVKE